MRTVESPDGRYVERCESYSPESYSFQYSLLESPHPYESYLGTVTFTAIDVPGEELKGELDVPTPATPMTTHPYGCVVVSERKLCWDMSSRS